MVDDPVDRQRHILHQPVHAALSLVVIIGSILSILPLQRRSALPRPPRSSSVTVSAFRGQQGHSIASHAHKSADRKSVVKGKSVSVRVDLGGRRIINNKKKNKEQTTIKSDHNKLYHNIQ